MSKLAQRVSKSVSTHLALDRLKKDLTVAKTPTEFLDVAELANQARQMFAAIGLSIQECNPFAEVYLQSYWKFGNLVTGVEPGRPQKSIIDNTFPGTKTQRQYGRKFRAAIQESDIPDYVKVATEKLEPASIAGCLEWIDPGRHGNLKGEYEWYTPSLIIEAVRAVLGTIDLDPASCEEAQETVQATEFFTEEQNGLKCEWSGRVFLNPPFAHPTVKYFAEKLLASFKAATVTHAVYLSNACTDTGWWQALAANGPVCFPEGRIKFKGPLDQGQSPTLGQTLIYLGDDHEKFRDVFGKFGVVLS